MLALEVPRFSAHFRCTPRIIARVDLFVRVSGRAGGPTVVFLHGGHTSGWSWQPVVDQLQDYHCLVPDLPQYGRSMGRFEMDRAADAVAKLIRSRAGSGRAHLVGYSLGAQVGTQLLATHPELLDRVLLCGTVINPLPAVPVTRFAMRLLARAAQLQWALRRSRVMRRAGAGTTMTDGREDLHFNTGAQFADIVAASAGFIRPAGLENADTPTLFVTGSEEFAPIRRWAARLARPMPNGIDRIAAGMHHNWPMTHPDLFARTVDAWLSDSELPPEIGLPENPTPAASD